MNKKGFSLIEVLITLSIISALSAIAVPQYYKYKDKAKRSEAQTSINTIVKAQKLVYTERGTYAPFANSAGVAQNTSSNAGARFIGQQEVFSACSGRNCSNYNYYMDVGPQLSRWVGAYLTRGGGNNLAGSGAGCSGWNSSGDYESFALLAVGDLNEDGTSTYRDAFYHRGGTNQPNRTVHTCDDIQNTRPDTSVISCGCTS